MNPQSSLTLPESYPLLLRDIKTRIRESQIKAALAVSQELLRFYWWIGREIVTRQASEKWGSRDVLVLWIESEQKQLCMPKKQGYKNYPRRPKRII